MKFKQEFVLRTIAGESILIPIGNANNTFNGVMSLNETGEFIWKSIENGLAKNEIVSSLTEEYDVTEEHALKSVEAFLSNLTNIGILENDL